jgi:DNA-binding NarL/FixJ family response regulator
MIKVAVLDDHPVVWQAVQGAIRAEADMKYVGHGANGAALVDVLEVTPDVLLLDVRLASDDGVEICERALQLQPQLRVIVFTAYGSPSLVLRALNAGAVGYVLKDTDLPGVVRAIRAVCETGSYIDSRLAGDALGAGRRTEAPLLTPRELEILVLIVKGATNREIAETLVVSQHTVKYHVENIKIKLGARRRIDVVRLAAERMLV